MKRLLSYILFITFVCTFISCNATNSKNSFEFYQVLVEESISSKSIDICGTIKQFYVNSPVDDTFKDFSSNKFVCSTQFPELYDLFIATSVIITGFMNTPPNSSVDEIFYRGYIQTSNIHYEGVFTFSNENQFIYFSIANSHKIKDVGYE